MVVTRYSADKQHVVEILGVDVQGTPGSPHHPWRACGMDGMVPKRNGCNVIDTTEDLLAGDEGGGRGPMTALFQRQTTWWEACTSDANIPSSQIQESQAGRMGVGTKNNGPSPMISLKDRAAWRTALRSPRPVLAHLNADTTWLLQLPIPASVTASPRSKAKSKLPRRTRYNILLDPWLRGPQSDVASWFSTQWHVVAPTVQTMKELDEVLAGLEDGVSTEGYSYIDCVVISHEFTDHCHEATLRELPRTVPVVATEKAADLIRSWKHFDLVITTPGFSAETRDWWEETLIDKTGTIPPWLGIGRVITQGNALYYHSAVLIAFDIGYNPNQRSTRSTSTAEPSQPEAIIYSPHGIKGSDLDCVKAAGIKTLALLHGLDDVRIWMMAQLNLGALNGMQAVKTSGAKFWISTHDEAKKGGGLISWLLQRTSYSMKDAIEAEEAKAAGTKEDVDFEFVELGPADGMVLA